MTHASMGLSNQPQAPRPQATQSIIILKMAGCVNLKQENFHVLPHVASWNSVICL